jgi:hypothetical protein
MTIERWWKDSGYRKRKCSEEKACPSSTTSQFLECTGLSSKPGYQVIVYIMYSDSVRTSHVIRHKSASKVM